MTLVALALLSASTLVSQAAPDTTASLGFTLLELPAQTTDQHIVRRLSAAPKGSQAFRGIPFQLGAPIVVRGLDSARAGIVLPDSVRGIKAGAQARRLHLLHGTFSPDKDGIPVAKIVFHYVDGTEASVRLGYGVHVRDWTPAHPERRSTLVDPNSHLVWPDPQDPRSAEFRLFQTALENPRPEQKIASMDVVSLYSRATPFLLAGTLDNVASGPATLPIPPRKAARDLLEFKDDTYRREFVVRITDGETSRPAVDAVASLTVLEDKEVCYFGETTPDAQGVCRIVYPPQDATGFRIWVHAPNRAPVLVAESKTNQTEFTGEYAVTLRKGTLVGGTVRQAGGQPISGAQVMLSLVTKLSPHHYNRVDYDVATTGADGKWTSQSLTPNLDGFTFQVSHPEYRPGLFATEGYADPPGNATSGSRSSSSSAPVLSRQSPGGATQPVAASRRAPVNRNAVSLLATNRLLAASAEMVLTPAILLVGSLVDPSDRPIPNAELILLREDAPADRKFFRTDAQGGFNVRVPEQSRFGLVAIVDGFAPLYREVEANPSVAAVALKMTPARVANGIVRDKNRLPIPGVRVRVEDWHNTTDLLRFTAVTDSKGRFAWPGAPLDQVTFYSTKTNFTNSRRTVSTGPGEITLQLNRPPGVFGRVYDADSGKPVPTFTVIPGRKYSTSDRQIRWERSEAMRGSAGEYGLKINSYMFQPEARVMVEAPGYLPQLSPPFRNSDSYTNDFVLRKGRGISGQVQLPDGSPAAGAQLGLVENEEYGSLENGGQIRNNNGNTDLVRADAQGRFEFVPKLEATRVFASHPQGFAEVDAGDLLKDGRIALQKWGRVKGVVRVGAQRSGEESVRVQNWWSAYPDPNSPRSRLSFFLKAELAKDGQFVCEMVPPGEHRVMLEHRFRENPYGELPLSHGIPVNVKAGETSEVTIGGSGRRVVGRVNLSGGDHSDVDWKRDVHRLILVRPGQPLPTADRIFNGGGWSTDGSGTIEERRRQEREERTYVLVFQTNGVFYADNIPPGRYALVLNLTDPEDEYYSRRSIGNQVREIHVPNEAGSALNAAFDLEEFDLTIRPRLKVGKVVPVFEAKTEAGATVKLPAHSGTNLVLYFWGLSVGYSSYDVDTLKQYQTSHGGDNGQVVILGLNLDQDVPQAKQFAQRQGMTWPQLYLGDWSQTPVPGMFGLNGNSGAVLIDPRGMLASGPQRGTALRNALSSLLD